jgi:hypothetical protein
MRPSVLAFLAFGAGAVGGVGSSIVLREARADALGEVMVPVPAEGVVFRANGGRPIVRIRAEDQGGSLEVLDRCGRVAVHLGVSPSGGIVELGPPSLAHPVMSLGGLSEDPGY